VLRPAAEDPLALIEKIRAKGMRAGITLKPGTPVEAVLPYADKVHLVLVMTVEPGFGGQSFMPEMMRKVRHPMELLQLSPACPDLSTHTRPSPCAAAGVGAAAAVP